MDITYEEDEIFFGPVSHKESLKLSKRKTEIFSPNLLTDCDDAVSQSISDHFEAFSPHNIGLEVPQQVQDTPLSSDKKMRPVEAISTEETYKNYEKEYISEVFGYEPLCKINNYAHANKERSPTIKTESFSPVSQSYIHEYQPQINHHDSAVLSMQGTHSDTPPSETSLDINIPILNHLNLNLDEVHDDEINVSDNHSFSPIYGTNSHFYDSGDDTQGTQNSEVRILKELDETTLKSSEETDILKPSEETDISSNFISDIHEYQPQINHHDSAVLSMQGTYSDTPPSEISLDINIPILNHLNLNLDEVHDDETNVSDNQSSPIYGTNSHFYDSGDDTQGTQNSEVRTLKELDETTLKFSEETDILKPSEETDILKPLEETDISSNLISDIHEYQPQINHHDSAVLSMQGTHSDTPPSETSLDINIPILNHLNLNLDEVHDDETNVSDNHSFSPIYGTNSHFYDSGDDTQGTQNSEVRTLKELDETTLKSSEETDISSNLISDKMKEDTRYSNQLIHNSHSDFEKIKNFHCSPNLSSVKSEKNESLNMNEKCVQRISNISGSSSVSSSPGQHFNDTLEAMEMLLTCGLQYFEDKKDFCETSAKVPALCVNDEIVCKKKTTISSPNSNSSASIIDSEHSSLESNVQMEVIKQPSTLKEDRKDVTLSKVEKKEDRKDFMTNVELKDDKKDLIAPKGESLFKPPTNLIESNQIYNEHKTPLSSLRTPKLTNSEISAANTYSHCPKYPTIPLKLSSNIPRPSMRTPSHQNFNSKLLAQSSNSHPYTSTPCITPHRPPLVPSNKTPANSVYKNLQGFSKTPGSIKKIKQMNIVSPVARYLQENPPPPLIATIKPGHMLTPHKLIKESLTSSPTHEYPHRDFDESSLKREITMSKNEEGLKKLTLQVNSKTPLKEVITKHEDASLKSQQILPCFVYQQGKVVQLENKENDNRKREIASDHPPPLILKHKGRTHISKVVGTEDGSFLEVSVHEPHFVHHTTTLK